MDPAMTTRRAYTLIEVLIAMLILAIMYPALSALVTGARNAQLSGYRIEQASASGRMVIDSLAILPGHAWTSGTSTQNIGGLVYTASWTKPGGASPWAFPVTVTWKQGKHMHQIQLRAILE